MDYIKDVVIPDTNKPINSAMNLSDYFCVIGCRLIMYWYVGHSARDFFLKYLITPQKGSPIWLNHIISVRRLEKITQVMSYTNLSIPEFNDTFFQQKQIQEGWNKNMAARFDPSWVGVFCDSIHEWINLYTWHRWMFVPCKACPFVNEYHTIECTKYKIIYNVDIVEGEDQTRVMDNKEF